jgi:hypothetical protein
VVTTRRDRTALHRDATREHVSPLPCVPGGYRIPDPQKATTATRDLADTSDSIACCARGPC